MASGQPEAHASRRRRGPSRLLTTLLALLAFVLIAFLLLNTYFQRERDRDYAESEAAVTSESGEDPGGAQAYDEAPPAQVADEVAPVAEPGEEPPTAQSAPLEQPVPAEPREVPVASAPEPAAPAPTDSREGTSALRTVRAFYAALGAGDGASAAQLVVPSKRQSGPLSAGALSRYYSSFRRPLRVRSTTPVDANTVRVAYDYVLADGRLCNGAATVRVVGSADAKLVSGIRTQGPC